MAIAVIFAQRTVLRRRFACVHLEWFLRIIKTTLAWKPLTVNLGNILSTSVNASQYNKKKKYFLPTDAVRVNALQYHENVTTSTTVPMHQMSVIVPLTVHREFPAIGMSSNAMTANNAWESNYGVTKPMTVTTSLMRRIVRDTMQRPNAM